MSTTRRAVSTLAVLFLMSFGTAYAYRQGRLIGKVMDAKGKPIAGVRVTTTSKAVPDFKAVTETDAKGVFKVDFERIGVVYVYELEKVGYAPLRVEQMWTVSDTDRHDFQMVESGAPTLGEIAAPAVPGTAADAAAAPAEPSSPAVGAFNDGVRAFKAKDYDTAAARLQEATTQDPSLRQAWVALSATFMQQRKYPQAAEAAEKAIALGATEPSVLETRWDAYRQMGDKARTAKAREDLERIAQLGVQAKGVYNEGVALQKFGDEERALAKYQAALELDPNFEPALLAMAASALKLGRAAEAYAAAQTALQANPASVEAVKVRYNAALKLKDEAKLAAALADLARVDAATARDGLFLLAQSAFATDDTKAAKDRLRRVLTLDPAHARAHYILGLIFMREGAKAEARTHLERFMQLAPADPDVASAKEALRLMP